MAPDPEPKHAVRQIDSQSTMLQTNTSGPKSANSLEVERRMTRINPQ
jgi:hypothetical protein